jgi:DNA-binding MarR family transcriptional regulator
VDRETLEAMFAYICKQHHDTSFPPSLRELADTFYMSTATVIRHLERMEGLGWVARDPGKARGITLIRTCGREEG